MTQQSYERLFINNRKFVEEKLKVEPEYFMNLAKSQSPKYLFIGCSDSRIQADVITGTGAGEMFVHRNIANQVIPTDMNIMAVIEYAVNVLKVQHIIVCGHYGCGGVIASMSDENFDGTLDKWLNNIKTVYRMNRQELDAITDPEKRVNRLVELNVIEQVYHVSMVSAVQKALAEGQDLQIHGWVYDLREGLLRDLNVDINKIQQAF